MPRAAAKRKRSGNSTKSIDSASSDDAPPRSETSDFRTKSALNEANYFPRGRKVVENKMEDWSSDPAAALQIVAAQCQDSVASQERQVYEIRMPVGIPWQRAISNMVHRRCPKPPRSTQDKLKPRTKDHYRCDPTTGRHEAIRIYSSCVCSGCAKYGHAPHVLVYFALFGADSAESLEEAIGMPIAKMLERKIPEDICKYNLVDRFFIQVLEPHHAKCTYSAKNQRILGKAEIERWQAQLLGGAPPQKQRPSRSRRVSSENLTAQVLFDHIVPDSPTVDVDQLEESSVISSEESSSSELEPPAKRQKICESSAETTSTSIVDPSQQSRTSHFAILPAKDEELTDPTSSSPFNVDDLFA
jgi:hypothetical protein